MTTPAGFSGHRRAVMTSVGGTSPGVSTSVEVDLSACLGPHERCRAPRFLLDERRAVVSSGCIVTAGTLLGADAAAASERCEGVVRVDVLESAG